MRLSVLAAVSACAVLFVTAASALAASPGDLIWAKRNGGTTAPGVSTFADGSMIVVGSFTGAAVFGPGEPGERTLTSVGGPDIYVARYNANGTLAWAKRAGGALNDAAQAVATFPDGSCAVTGQFFAVATFGPGETNQTILTAPSSGTLDFEIFVARYNANGTLAWARKAGGNTQQDIGRGVATLADGTIIVCGQFNGAAKFDAGLPTEVSLTSAGGIDAFLAKFSGTGTVVWAKRLGGGTGVDIANALGSTPDGGAVVTGLFAGTATFGAGDPSATTLVTVGGSDVFLARCDPNGALLWARREGNAGSEQSNAIKVFADGSSAIVGSWGLGPITFGAGQPTAATFPFGGAVDAFLARHNADGTFRWARVITGPSVEVSRGLTGFADGSLLVTGGNSGAATFGAGQPNETVFPPPATGQNDVYVARYDADGTFLWARAATGIGGDSGTAAAALADGSAIVTGNCFSPSITFAPGEANQTTLPGPCAWVARYGGTLHTEIVSPANVVQECDDEEHEGTVVTFDVPVFPGTADLLRVRDVTGDRTLLEVNNPAYQTYTVGPATFPHGASSVLLELLDHGVLIGTATTNVQIEDTIAPVLDGCEAKTIELEGPLTTLYKSALGITVTDACDPAPTVEFSPSAVPLGTTTVTATARDATGNSTECVFDVTVVDTRPPEFTVLPADIERECESGGTLVSFDVLAEDLSGTADILCTDETGRTVDKSGTLFDLGEHTVTCTASDSSGNTATDSFHVTIVDTQDPVVVCPGDITVGNDPGECFAAVAFAVTVSDECDPDAHIDCTAPWGPVESGDQFPVGTTLVTCTATDHSGNVGSCSFHIKVEDREPPVMSGPSSVTLVTDCAGHALSISPAALGVTATDNCDPTPTLVCSPASILPGTTTVVCTATDDDGNSSQKTIAVTLLRGPFEVRFQSPLDGNAENKLNVGQTIALKVRVSCDNVAETGASAFVDRVERINPAGTVLGLEAVADSGASSGNTSAMRLTGSQYHYNLSTKAWSSGAGARFRVVIRIVEPGHVDTFASVILKNK